MDAQVIDTSATLGFLLPDEQDAISKQALANIGNGVPSWVPVHWPVELANALLMAERRKRISRVEAHGLLKAALALPLTTDEETTRRLVDETSSLARQFGLTIYDAAYLELAMRRNATLATTDRDLAKAAKDAGVKVLKG